MLVAFAPGLARGDTLTWRGATITYTGAELKWSDPAHPNTDESEPILVYKTNGSFSSTAGGKARILAVGGGGAGGTICKDDYEDYPGGGGGGAGEFLDRLTSAFAKEKGYTITIGAGGVADGKNTKESNGKPGQDTVITVDGGDYIRVKGGGGGGGEDVGQKGGSGGGGATGEGSDSGSSVTNESDGQGHAGGESDGYYYAGGGGGAKEDGHPGDPDSEAGGAGGDGVVSDIDPSNVRAYAGGGGGGTTESGSAVGGAGGAGGGGHGGKYANSDAGMPTAGEPNTGSGGGGGGRTKVGAAGGSGIVIIRISSVDQEMLWRAIEVVAKGGNKGLVFVASVESVATDGDDRVFTYKAEQAGLSFALRDDMKLIPEQEAEREKYTANIPVWATARILAVGGGGGGGMVNEQNVGAGAGGGAGGFVEGGLDGKLIFDNGDVYTIAVGRGGAGGAQNEAAGKKGGDTSVVKGGTDVVPVAKGGGGGGAHSAGEDGASGGGGSRGTTSIEDWKYDRPGGKGFAGQGHAGGTGNGTYLGAGGGGAGGPGGDALDNYGGSGTNSFITGSEEWYAGGGGGAYVNASSSGAVAGGAGGAGGGGHGAGIEGGSVKAAEDGIDGKGGGGGGGVSYAGAPQTAGRGGHGVVIIRLSGFVVKDIPLPEANGPFTYDGTEHVGVDPFFAYMVVTNETSKRTEFPTGVEADNYVVRVEISPTLPPDVQWKTGGRAPQFVRWAIRPMPVDRPTALTGFVFGNGKTGAQLDEEEKLAIDKDRWLYDPLDQSCGVTNQFATRLPYCTLTGHRQTNAGSYTFTARLTNSVDAAGLRITNFVWKVAPPDGTAIDPWPVWWEIARAPNEITSLSIEDWQEGTTNKTPKSDWKWRNVMEKHKDHYPNWENDIVKYKWREKGKWWAQDDWMTWSDLEKQLPKEAGVYELGAHICVDSSHTALNEYGNWDEAESVVRFCIWRHPSKSLADWMDMTFTHSSTKYITVSLRDVGRNAAGAVTSGYPGFAYADVVGDGNKAEIRFVAVSNIVESKVADCDKDNPLARDELLAFDASAWSRTGVSTVKVKMPANSKSPNKIRMYWRRRPDQSAILEDKLASEVPVTSGGAITTYNLVNQLQRVGEDGRDVRAWVNYWETEPTVTRYVEVDKLKNSGTPKDINPGALKAGTVDVEYLRMPPGEVVDFDYVKTNCGPYTVHFTLRELETGTAAYPGPHKYYDGDRTLDLEIYKDRPQPIDPTGAGVASLRVLLANDDFGVADPANAVSNQSYWAWTHWNQTPPPSVISNGTAVITNNLLPGTSHALLDADGKVLWDIDDAYLGNTMSADLGSSAATLTNQRSLPWSWGARNSSTNRESYLEPLTRRGVGQIVLRNVAGEAGDRHNWANGAVIRSPWYTNGVGTVYFDAVNGFAAGTTASTVPAASFRLAVEVSTNAFDNMTSEQESNAVWRVVKVQSLKLMSNTAFDTAVKGDYAELALPAPSSSTANGNATNRFYRIIAQMPADCARVPCRFRIRRISALDDSRADAADDWRGFIVVDNVIASWPTEVVDFGSRGWRDPAKSGKQVVGWETAMSVDYPSATETNLHVLASYPGDPSVVTSVRCHWRWRYLDAQDGGWNVMYLDPNDGFRSIKPIELPGIPGDLEFWYDLTAVVPFYAYADYCGMKIDKPTGDYTENPEKGVTSRRSSAEEKLPSRGTDWFVRLREGASEYGSVRAHFRDAVTKEKIDPPEFVLCADHLWRGFLRTGREMAGKTIEYRFEALKPTASGLTKASYATNRWYATDLVKAPNEVPPASPGMIEDPTGAKWAKVSCDAATGHLLFQFDDRTPSLTISHADYQDFNGWSDAASDDDPPFFTGSSIADDRKSGVSSKMVRVAETFDGWFDTPESKKGWAEHFAGNATVDDGTHTGWAPFFTAATPNGWTARNAMWTTRFYHPTDAASRGQSGLAVELSGASEGGLQLLDWPEGEYPRGLGAVKFKARVAQPIDFVNFNYTKAERPSQLKDYTFITRAAFDLNKNRNFAGNATLSLVAFYDEKLGCYELRWEQLKGTYDTKTSKFTGIARDSQRLCLYRWAADETGYVTEELLGAVTNNVSAKYKWSEIDAKGKVTTPEHTVDMTKNNRVRQPEAIGYGASDYFLPMYIAAKAKDDGSTEIAAGVFSCGGNNFDNEKGGLNPAAEASDYSSRKWLSVFYRDTSAKRLKGGAYGVLSANCEAVFLRPAKRSAMSLPSATNIGYTKNEFCAFANTTVNFAGDYMEVKEDLAWGDWSLDFDRMDWFDSETSSQPGAWGLYAKTPSARLDLVVGAWGSPDGEVVASRTVEGFGTFESAGRDQEITVKSVRDGSVQLRAAESLRTDVVVTDVEFTQWRGDSYGADPGDTLDFAAGEAKYGYPSNIVFTSGTVVTNTAEGLFHKVRLSAKRTPVGKPSSVRSPFFDGGYNAVGTRRGLGLGMMSVAYENAQTNVNLLVQIATNVAAGADVTSLTQSVDTNMDWTTVTNFSFATVAEEDRRKGVRSVYFGLHGRVGMMRVVIDPEVVANVQTNGLDDANAYGEIDIVKVVCRDEPTLEASDWWGWNVRTAPVRANSVGDDLRTYLPDGDNTEEGMPIAVNNSVRENVPEEDQEIMRENMPFVQTPTFTNNIVGEVSFRARRYDNGDASQYAEVYLYGAHSGDEADPDKWQALHRFVVSNVTWEAYSFRAAGTYSAFRFAVTGVEGVDKPGKPRAYDPAVRVLLDEVMVFEAVRPSMGFRYVYPFRDGLDETAACTNVVDAEGRPLADAQPLCNESWTVQAEITKNQLPEEIDMTVSPPRVVFHWFEGRSPWGWENWKGLSRAAGHNSAELALADGETMVFRGSMERARDAIVSATTRTPTVVQFAADVIFHTVSGTEITNSLVRNAAITGWERPDWYEPVDYNANEPVASPYTIIDAIAPHRVWINEINVWDGQDKNYVDLAGTNQYVEIAAPELQSLEGWRLDYIAYDFTTNTLVDFTSLRTGAGYAPARKDLSKVPAAKLGEYRTNDYVFIAVQSPNTRDAKTWDGVPGAIDGTWSKFDQKGSALIQKNPIALRLVRPSLIVEQEIAFEGTNLYTQGAYAGEYSVTGWIARLEKKMGAKTRLYNVGHEYDNRADQSLGVVRNTGLSADDWTNKMRKTPGRVNEGQVIPEGWVLYPNGELMLVRAQIGANGHLLQAFGDGDPVPTELTMMIRKGGEGTNITYTVAPWWEIASVTTNRQPVADVAGAQGTYVLKGVGAGASNDVTVVADVRPMEDLRTKYGLTEDNRYTPAVMDWLEKGVNLFGEPFENPGEIHLAEFRTPYTYTYITNLDLTAMYWLDIDPTTNWVLKAGVVASRHGGVLPIRKTTATGETVTNFRMGLHMEITNETSGVAYAPYVLRGLDPGQTTTNYAGNWNSANFKITADIQNGVEGRTRWIPVRWFVFKPKPGATSKVGASASFGDEVSPFHATVDVWDPKDPKKAWYTKPWADYPDAPIFYRWALDGRNAPVEIETLWPDSTF